MYFQRLRLDYSQIHVSPNNMSAVMTTAIEELAVKHDMTWTLSYDNVPKRVVLLVSKDDHCLYDILIRHRSGELACDVVTIVSNHEALRPVADMFGIPFRHLPIPPKADGGKRAQELQIEALLEAERIDLIVLARYMQILTPEFCDKYWSRTINIHHSFLPAFEGARPYHRAHVRGVKIIGATAHYATTDLDAGPIIEQDVTRINHSDSVADMIRKGRDLERLVLARAVRWHIADAVIVHGNKTVVFES
ncbi:formyl transferase [Tribonema minus]|uniref:Formyl transferase n=1 Tax=Tribonema minus TaxID=303371 RepID=A0A836CC35_9STRA|nr:formyl transferase [Tribonema minus]